MLNRNVIRNILINGSIKEKFHVLENLKDEFDSFNKNIENLTEIIYTLIEHSITECNIEVKIEIFETLSKAAVFQNIENIDFNLLIDNIDNIPEECLSRCIDILSFSHKMEYLPTIKKYLNHTDPYIQESAEYAMKEIVGYHEKNK